MILAVQFLTRLPTPQIADFKPQDLSRSAVFFPAVGLIIGVFVSALAWGFSHINPLLGGLAGTVIWVWITGGLHLDGLGDVADAMGAAHAAPERFQEVLRDPHAGSFAVMVIALQLIAKVSVIGSLGENDLIPALILVPALARWGTLFWSKTVPPLKQGLGERFAWAIGWRAIAAWAAVLGLACGLGCPPLLVAFLVVPAVSVYWLRGLGGISGDCLGASVEVTESVLLLIVCVGGVLGAS